MGAARPARDPAGLTAAGIDRHPAPASPVDGRDAARRPSHGEAAAGGAGTQLLQWLLIFAVVSVPILGAKWWSARQDADLAPPAPASAAIGSTSLTAVPATDAAAGRRWAGGRGADGAIAAGAGREVGHGEHIESTPSTDPSLEPASTVPAGVPVVRAPAEVPYPTRLVDVIPVIPDESSARRGIAVLSLLIDTEGNVVDVELLRSVDHTLDTAAVTAARQWKFAPTVRDGTAVAVRSNFTVPFGY